MACAVTHDTTRLECIQNLPTTSSCVALPSCSVPRAAREAGNNNWASDSIALDKCFEGSASPSFRGSCVTVRMYTRRVYCGRMRTLQ